MKITSEKTSKRNSGERERERERETKGWRGNKERKIGKEKKK